MADSHWISIGLAGIVVVLILVVFLNRRPRMKHGEILPAKEMKEKYNLTAERYKPPHLDPEKVPEQLRDLLPLAAKWGIGDDIIRDDFEQKSSEAEKQELKSALAGRMAEVTQWLDSFEVGKPMPEEAACFMYMQEALDEMRLWPDQKDLSPGLLIMSWLSKLFNFVPREELKGIHIDLDVPLWEIAPA